MAKSNPRRQSGPALPPALEPLKDLQHWLVWKYQTTKTGKPTKVPFQIDGSKAKSTDPSTRVEYDAALSASENFDGIGFALLDSGIAAFDIDDCRDPETGEIEPWAQQLVDKAASYAEVTPSKTGLRILGYGTGTKVHRKLPVPNANGTTVEVYRQAERYITITGDFHLDAPLVDIDAQIDAVIDELTTKKEPKRDGPKKKSNGKKLPQELRIMLHLKGDAPADYPSRSELLHAFVGRALRLRIDQADITAACLDMAHSGNSIFEHVKDNGGAGYVARQIAKFDVPDFEKDTHGNPKARSQKNIAAALRLLGIDLRHDVFEDRALITGLDGYGILNDAAIERLWLLIDDEFKFLPPKDFFWVVVSDIARRNSFHPVIDYLDGLKWDGKKRIDTWLIDCCQAEDSPYVRAVGALMLIAGVRRIRKPGSKFDEMLIFESDQGKEKSEALATLAVNPQWFSDDLPLGADSKRMIEHLRGRWIIEAAELNGMRKAEIEHMKSFLSRQVDRARMSYDRKETTLLRQCVIFGTTNHPQYLKDQTGNRRFWPVKVGTFDIAALRRERDQLWAEASAREMAGESIRLDRDLWTHAAVEQQERTIDEPWIEVISAVLGDHEGKLLAADAWKIINLSVAQRTQAHNERLGSALRLLGWKRTMRRFDGRPQKGYVRGESKQRIKISRAEDGTVSVTLEKDETGDEI